MNISDLEECTSLSRANIRFYEDAGLIVFARDKYNNRIYRDEDVQILKKIALMRMLRFGINDIAQFQLGDESNNALLRERLANINKDMNVDEVTYESLDATAFLALMSTQTFFRREIPASDSIDCAPHPWRRYFARSSDFGIYQVLVLIVWLHLLRQPLPDNWVLTYLFGLISAVVCFLLEPIWLSRLGTTPGKWMMGLRVQSSGQLPSSQQARKRTFQVLTSGMGYHIPIYSLVVQYRFLSQSLDKKMMPWDEETEMIIKDTKGWRIAGLIFASIVQIWFVVWLNMQFYLPLHRGRLTPQQYYANVNDIMRKEGYPLGLKVTETGEWVGVVRSDGSFFMSMHEQPRHQLMLDDGFVIGVVIETTSTDNVVFINSPHWIYAYQAFVGAQKGVSGFDVIFSRALEIPADGLTFSLEENGMVISHHAIYSGYERYGSLLTGQETTEKRHYKGIYVIEKIRK